MTAKEKAEYYSFLHKQNLNGRESEDELFEIGIQVGIEETEKLQDEFAINFLHWYLNNDDIKKFSYSYENLLKTYKKEKGL